MNRRVSVLLIVLIVAIVGGALILGLSGNKTAANGCEPDGSSVHRVAIQNGHASQLQVHAKLCDTLVIFNQDNFVREIAFGEHDHHVPYDGIAERVVGKGQSVKVTLNQAGTFHWHDHFHDSVQGYFTVSR